MQKCNLFFTLLNKLNLEKENLTKMKKLKNRVG